MSIGINDREANPPGNGSNTGEGVRPLKEILTDNIEKVNAGYRPPEKGWQPTGQPGRKAQAVRPLKRILSARIEEIDSPFTPPADPQEMMRSPGNARPFEGKPFALLAPYEAKGQRGDWRMASDLEYAEQGTGLGPRAGNSQHTGDTWGENQTLHTLRSDLHAREMLDRTMMGGQSPEEDAAYIRGRAMLPHYQIAAPLAAGAMTGVAKAVTPVVETGAKGVNAIFGETDVGKDMADFGGKVNVLRNANNRSIEQNTRFSQNGELTPLGHAVKQGSKFTELLAQNAITQTIPALGAFNHLYDTQQAWEQAYRKKRDALEAEDMASERRRHPAEKESLAYREALLEALTCLLAPGPADVLKRATRADTDSSLTAIAQNAMTDQGSPQSQAIIRRMLENLIQTSQWDEDHF